MTAILASLLLAGVGVTAQPTVPTVTLTGGIDSGLAPQPWPHADVDDAPLRLHYDDEDLTVAVVLNGHTAVDWYWEYAMQQRGTIHTVVAGPCDAPSPPAGCAGEQPLTIPAADLDAAGGWYTYYLTYRASNGAGTATEHLEVRILPASLRPALAVSGHDATAMTLGHPFQLAMQATLPHGGTDPVYEWNGVAGTTTLTVDTSGSSHGDALPVTAQAFDGPGLHGDVPTDLVELELTLDLAPVFTVAVPSASVGETLTPTLGLTYPSAADTQYAYSWKLDGTEVGTGATLELDEGTFGDGDTVTLTVTATNTASGGSRAVTAEVDLVDTVAPVVTVAADRAPNQAGWYTAPVTLTASGTDGGGVASCDPAVTYNGPNGADRTVTLSCTDTAGNTGSGTLTFDYDASAPAVGVTVSAWTKGGNVGFQVSDPASGVASWSAQYRVDGGAWQALGGTGEVRELPVTTEGAVIAFRVQATDVAGNQRALPTAPDASTTIDTTPPGTPAGLQATPQAGGGFSLTWTAATASGAPVDRYLVQHRVAGGSFSTLGNAATTSHAAALKAADGSTHEFRVAAVDRAGNQGPFSDVASAVAHNRAPTGTLTVVSTSHGDGPAEGDEATFAWTALLSGPGETVVYRYALSQEPTLALDATALTTTGTTVRFNDVAPGTWYFHLLGVGTGGTVAADPLRIEVIAPVGDDEVAAANKAVQVALEEQEEGVLVSWTLPDDLPAAVAGVQVWVVEEDGSLTLLRTLDEGEDAFSDRSYLAEVAATYAVTVFYERGEGRFTLQAPPSEGQYTAWDVQQERFQEASGNEFPVKTVLYAGAAVLVVVALGVGGFFLLRSRRRAPASGY